MDSSLLTIILNWNGKSDTLACLKSLEQTGCPAQSILVVDNGSADDSVQAIRALYPQVELIETGENLGFSGGNNVGIEWGLKKGFENFLLLNNDTVVAKDLFAEFLKALRAFPTCGIFGAKVYMQSDPIRLDHLGGNWNFRRAAMDFVGMRELDEGNFEAPLQLDYVCGAAMLVRKAVFEKIGLLDPRFFLYWEDTDLCFRARRAGFEVRVCPAAKIWHKVSASASLAGKPFTNYYSSRNYLLWLEKNHPWREKIVGYFRILFFMASQSVKLLFKQLKIWMVTGEATRRKALLLQQKAKLKGCVDYFLRRFGKQTP